MSETHTDYFHGIPEEYEENKQKSLSQKFNMLLLLFITQVLLIILSKYCYLHPKDNINISKKQQKQQLPHLNLAQKIQTLNLDHLMRTCSTSFVLWFENNKTKTKHTHTTAATTPPLTSHSRIAVRDKIWPLGPEKYPFT